METIRIVHTDTGTVKLFVQREKRGGPISSVIEKSCADTSREVEIPLDIKDDELLEKHINAIKGDRGIES